MVWLQVIVPNKLQPFHFVQNIRQPIFKELFRVVIGMIGVNNLVEKEREKIKLLKVK